MAMPVLATKLFVPRPRPQAISRPRLIEQLSAGVQAGRKLTLVSAPAGFGKTTLLAEWIDQTRRRDPRVRIAWLSLDERDNDPARFLSYLAATLHQADPNIGTGTSTGTGTGTGTGQYETSASAEATLTGFINAIAGGTPNSDSNSDSKSDSSSDSNSESTHGPSPLILFLDDFHLIEDVGVREAVVFLLDHLPPTMHVALSSRSDPLLPLARMRASGDLTEVRAADLARLEL